MPSKSEPQTLAHNYERTSRPTGEDISILTRTLHSHYYLPHPRPAPTLRGPAAEFIRFPVLL